jgi:hypothetical protein
MGNSKKKYEKFKKQFFSCQPCPECGYFAKTSIFVFSGPFWGFLWLSLALKNLVKFQALVWTTGITKISLVVEIQEPEALNQHKNTKNKRFRMII